MNNELLNAKKEINRKIFLKRLEFDFQEFKNYICTLHGGEELLLHADEYAFYDRIIQIAKYNPELISDQDIEILLQEVDILNYIYEYWNEVSVQDQTTKCISAAASDIKLDAPSYEAEITLSKVEGDKVTDEFYSHTLKCNDVLALKDMVIPVFREACRHFGIKNGEEVYLEERITEDGEYFDSDEDAFRFYNPEKCITEESTGIHIDGHIGTWHVIDKEERAIPFDMGGITTYFLLEHEQYGKSAARMVVNEEGEIVASCIYNGFRDLHCQIDTLNDILTELTALGYTVDAVKDTLAVTLCDPHGKKIGIPTLSSLIDYKGSLKQIVSSPQKGE